MVARPVISPTLALRAAWRTNCSVVRALMNACSRACCSMLTLLARRARWRLSPDRPAAGWNRVIPDWLVSLWDPPTARSARATRSAGATRRLPTEFGHKLLLAEDQRGVLAATGLRRQ